MVEGRTVSCQCTKKHPKHEVMVWKAGQPPRSFEARTRADVLLPQAADFGRTPITPKSYGLFVQVIFVYLQDILFTYSVLSSQMFCKQS